MRSFKLEKKNSGKKQQAFSEKEQDKKLIYASLASVVGLFIIGILFYIGTIYVFWNSYYAYKETKKSKYLVICIAAAVFFILIVGLNNAAKNS